MQVTGKGSVQMKFKKRRVVNSGHSALKTTSSPLVSHILIIILIWIYCVKLSMYYSPTFMVSTVLAKRKSLVVLSLSDEFKFICSLEDKEGNEA